MDYITIAMAEKEETSSLWVLNNSGSSGNQVGVVNITIPEGNGQVNTIRIPNTFVPIDITTQATKQAVISNPQFRRMIMGNMLKIVSSESAEAFMQLPENKAEQQRLFSLGRDELPTMQETAPASVKDMLNENEGQIGGFAMNLAHTSEGDEDSLVANLKSNASTLSVAEMKYIVNNSTFPKVKAEAARHIIK